jgi:hypothetical protein
MKTFVAFVLVCCLVSVSYGQDACANGTCELPTKSAQPVLNVVQTSARVVTAPVRFIVNRKPVRTAMHRLCCRRCR